VDVARRSGRQSTRRRPHSICSELSFLKRSCTRHDEIR
jgi:hypothetical protein